MAHTYAAILTSIWADKDFLALTAEAQRLYLFLLSQPSLSQVGYLDINLKKWSNKATNLEMHAVEKQLAELEINHYVVADYESDELLVRTYVRNSGAWKQPLIVAAMVSAVVEIESPKLRRALLYELDRLPLHELKDLPSPKGGPSMRVQVTLRVQAVREALLKGLPTCDVSVYETEAKGYREPSREGLANPLGIGTGLGSSSSVTSKDSSSSSSQASQSAAPDADATPPTDGVDETAVAGAKITKEIRADVKLLCERLAELVIENGGREPTVGKVWWDAARLLLDKDRTGPAKERITVEKALRLIEWCQQDPFWAPNVQSMASFRKRYDQLRGHALREWNERNRPPQLSKAQQRAANNQAVFEDFLREEYGAEATNAWGDFIPGEVVRREIA